MILFSILTALYIAKINPFMAYIQFRLKQRLNKKRIKPLDCTACLAFWLCAGTMWYFNQPWEMWAISLPSAFMGGSLIEKAYYKL